MHQVPVRRHLGKKGDIMVRHFLAKRPDHPDLDLLDADRAAGRVVGHATSCPAMMKRSRSDVRNFVVFHLSNDKADLGLMFRRSDRLPRTTGPVRKDQATPFGPLSSSR
jgi:hypothetical protein